jgi:hypothetical protein
MLADGVLDRFLMGEDEIDLNLRFGPRDSCKACCWDRCCDCVVTGLIVDRSNVNLMMCRIG